MRDKDLIAKLNNLKQIKPDSEWQTRSRAVLLSQIKRGVEFKTNSWFNFIESKSVQRFFMELTRPVTIAAVVVIAVFGGGLVSIKAANQTKPGDPLYIAKIISERTQLALTFDNTKKAKLNLEFAANRVEELQKVNSQTGVKQETVDQLSDEFKSQLDEAKTRIAKINRQEDLAVAQPSTDGEQNQAQADHEQPANAKSETAKPKEKAKVESANLSKSRQAIQYFDPAAKMIDDAEKAFDQKDYQQSAATLQSLKDNIDKPVVPVKATTTEEKKEAPGTATSGEEELR